MSDEWSPEVYSYELSVAAAKLDEMDPDEASKTENIRSVISHFPTPWKIPAFSLLNGLQNRIALKKFAMEMQMKADEASAERATQVQMQEHSRELRTFWAGLALLGVALAVSIGFPLKDPSTLLILRLISGLGLALVIAFLPGIFALDAQVNQPTLKITLKSTGAFAGLVMAYLFDPGSLSHLLR